jgi:hypothetical protein
MTSDRQGTRIAGLVAALATAACVSLRAPEPERPTESRCLEKFVWNDAIAQRGVRRAQPVPAAEARRTFGALEIEPSRLRSQELAEHWFEQAKPLEAPATKGDVIVLCSISVTDGRGLDPLLGDPSLGVHFAPDIKVLAKFGAAVALAGPAVSKNRAVFAFKPSLVRGDSVELRVFDADVFSADDPIGQASTRYPGRFPFRLTAERFVSECRALSATSGELRRAEAAWERAVAAFEAHRPKVGAIFPRGAREELVLLASEVEFFRPASPATSRDEGDARYERIRRASLAHQHAFMDGLLALGRELPPPGTWVRLDQAPFDARVVGLICQTGRLLNTCHVEVALRARSDTQLCAALSQGGPLQPSLAISNKGHQTYLSLFGIWKGSRFVETEAELEHVTKGEQLNVELAVGSIKPSPAWDEHDWSIPLIQLGGTMLRVH